MSNEITPFAVKSLAEIEKVESAQFNLPTVSVFAARMAGKSFPKGTRASLKALEKLGVSKDNIKLARKAFDTHRAEYFRNIRAVNAVLASDPSYRQQMKVWRNKKGDIVANTMYRKSSVVSTATFDELKAKLAAAEEQIVKLTALPA